MLEWIYIFGTHLFFGILKIRGFVYVRMNLYCSYNHGGVSQHILLNLL